jgi:hypothetical protein
MSKRPSQIIRTGPLQGAKLKAKPVNNDGLQSLPNNDVFEIVNDVLRREKKVTRKQNGVLAGQP